MCSICISDNLNHSTITMPCCKQAFHLQCIAKWIQCEKITCPLCRSIIPQQYIAIIDPFHSQKQNLKHTLQSLFIEQGIKTTTSFIDDNTIIIHTD